LRKSELKLYLSGKQLKRLFTVECISASPGFKTSNCKYKRPFSRYLL